MKVSPILWDWLSRCGIQNAAHEDPACVAVSEMPSARQMGGHDDTLREPVHTAYVGRLVSHRIVTSRDRHKSIADTIVQ